MVSVLVRPLMTISLREPVAAKKDRVGQAGVRGKVFVVECVS